MLSNFVRRLSYVPAVRNLVGATGLREVAQKMYHHRFGPTQGVLPLDYGGASARFATPTIRELRGLELFSSGGDTEFKRLIGMISPGDVFFDVGAQYGVYAYLISNAVGPSVKVVAFEPFPRDFVLLERNAALNAEANVQCVNAALSDCEARLSMSASDGMQEICPRVGVWTADSQQVPAHCGDALIAAGTVPFPNVLKLDVEGHEMAVLRGLSNTLADDRCHSIYCEIHDALLPAGEDAATLIALLREKGFVSIEDCPGPNHYVFAAKRTVFTDLVQ
jgi:FkbM family methyltransferase